MKLLAAIAGGLAGTIAIASLHEAMRRFTSDAPRIDLLDMELIRKGLTVMDKEIPDETTLERMAVAGELVCDTTYFTLAGIGNKNQAVARGALLGFIAGLAAVVSPKPLGLKEEFTNKTAGTQLMTVGLYLIGGLTAAAVSSLVEDASA